MILTEQVRIVPLVNYYVIEVVYESVEVKLNFSEYDVLQIREVNNWGTAISKKKGFQPLIINGKQVKSINQFQNKKKGKLES